MFRLAWRQLLLDPARTLLTALAIGAVVTVILVLSGFEQGQYYQLKQAVLDRKADLIALQSGVANLLAARSSLPQLTRIYVEDIPGVKIAHPMTALPVMYQKGGHKMPIYLMVYDTRGGPVKVIDGKAKQKGNDIIIDSSIANKLNVKVGDDFIISDFTFKVSGITEGAAALFTAMAFITYDGMIDLFLESEIAPDISTFPLLSFLLVDLKKGADREQVRRSIENAVPAVDVYTPEALAKNGANLGKEILGPVMGLLVNVGYIIGLLVITLISSAEARHRLRGFGVMKALGFSHAKLVLALGQQIVLLLLIALPIGFLMALVLASIFNTTVPLYIVRITEPIVLGQTLIGTALFAMVGALIPLRMIRRADPMIAFQEA
ncbi:MAG: ABC transporter permease [Gammaproteobacteria bacterium]|nr:ABC transporter permease [Gammaproteobacteria bacterium]